MMFNCLWLITGLYSHGTEGYGGKCGTACHILTGKAVPPIHRCVCVCVCVCVSLLLYIKYIYLKHCKLCLKIRYVCMYIQLYIYNKPLAVYVSSFGYDMPHMCLYSVIEYAQRCLYVISTITWIHCTCMLCTKFGLRESSERPCKTRIWTLCGQTPRIVWALAHVLATNVVHVCVDQLVRTLIGEWHIVRHSRSGR